ncbi:vancomycin D-type resistance protein VanD [Enterococcus faecalis]|uniref:D-alanine--(R)-lactate ligase VanD n=1 Tax=Enterococcus faecalis TaxID=1351 RepID=UPI00230474F8|nr:D-alanine--(R)-lactate ligase VanD [Enterococcus faecalis]BDQ54349.1 vancomycin D-type resistance protein VanD [Enterococcus faecalis]
MYKINVAVLFGGCSEEHTVSIKSAMELATNIDTEKYQPFYIGITKSGIWKLCEKPCLDWERYARYSVVFSPDRNTHGFLIQKEAGYEAQPVDVVFPMIHGKFGEDGSIQGLLELSGIPYVGCDIQSSAICMDKSLAYTVVKNAGIEVPDFQIIQDGGSPKMEKFSFPLFVKPARSGSSFGVNKVEKAEDLCAAINEAGQYDRKVLIEQAVSGSEVGCAVLGTGTDLIVGEVDQISLKHGFFKIHQEVQPEKGSENATIKVPADLPVEVRERIQETAKKVYQTLGCKGLARIDMFLREDGQIVLNEVNTMPGFTSYSRYPRMMTAAGFTLSELIDRLIELALRR